MRQEIYIEDLKSQVGKDVTLRGWLYNKRSSGKIQFLELRDGTGICQCVVMKNHVDEATFAAYDKLTQESSFAVTGTVQQADKAPGGYEVFAKSIEIFQIASSRIGLVAVVVPGASLRNSAETSYLTVGMVVVFVWFRRPAGLVGSYVVVVLVFELVLSRITRLKTG